MRRSSSSFRRSGGRSMNHQRVRIDDLYFLVMEYVKGVNLSELVNKSGPLLTSTACRYIRPVCAGSERRSHNGHIHCDIKPQNLRLTPEDQVKVMDFGLAHIATFRCHRRSMT